MSRYQVLIRGELVDDDGLDIDCGPITGAWWEVPLPQCPDCGGDVIWYEAGHVPGTRACAGQPVGVQGDGRKSYAAENGRLTGGCGSIFSAQTRDGHVWLIRERLYGD